MAKLRTFIAFHLPGPVREHIRDIQDRLRPCGFRMRWVRPESVHLTLKFLGDIDPAAVEPITGALSEAVAGVPPVRLSLGGIGVFPTVRRARVLWVGLRGDTHPLIQIQKRIDTVMEGCGFPRETRPFKAHLTLGRAKGVLDPRRLAEIIEDFADMEAEPFTADEVILYRSELKPDGAVYTRLSAAVLTP